MDTLLSLWTSFPTLKVQLVVIAMLAQMAIAFWCYSRMSKARVSAAKAGEIKPEMYVAVGDSEPEALRVYTRVVANQFESPVLFYAIVITGLAIGATSWITVGLAVMYVLFRFRHASEMMGEHVVLRRRKIFIRSMQVLIFMMIDLAVSTLFFLSVQ